MLKQITSKYIFGLIFIVFVTSDFISKIGYQYRSDLVYTSQIIKAIFQLLAIVFIIKNYTSKYKTIYLSVFSLVFIHCIGLLFLDSEYSFLQKIKGNFVILNWYLFIFVFFLASKIYLTKHNRFSEAIVTFLKTCFEIYFYLNLIAVIIGFLGNYELFSAYVKNSRFGYDGLIRNISHASYISIIYLIYFYYQHKNNSSIKNRFNLFLSVLFIFFLATKAVLLFFVLFIAFILYKKSKIILPIVAPLFFVVVFLSKDYILNVILPNYSPILHKIYTNEGLITMLTSLRSKQFTELFIPYVAEKWGVMNYLFGGFDASLRKIEFELIDLLLTFGIIGIIIYLFTFFKYVIPINFIREHSLLLALFIVVFFAGSFFSSIPALTVFVVFYIIADSLKPTENNLIKQNE